jgi:hypothetical protein
MGTSFSFGEMRWWCAQPLVCAAFMRIEHHQLAKPARNKDDPVECAKRFTMCPAMNLWHPSKPPPSAGWLRLSILNKLQSAHQHTARGRPAHKHKVISRRLMLLETKYGG